MSIRTKDQTTLMDSAQSRRCPRQDQIRLARYLNGVKLDSRQRLDHGSGGVGPHMNTTGPGVSNGSRETCVSSVDSQSRQRPGRGSGGNTSNLPDDSRDLSTSSGFVGVSTPVGTPYGDDNADSAVNANLSHVENALTGTDPHHDTALFEGDVSGVSIPAGAVSGDFHAILAAEVRTDVADVLGKIKLDRHAT